MIIRSQDKKKIVPLNQPIYVEVVGNEWKVSTERHFLGTYSTIEKAIKVLDMIQDAYAKCESIKVITSGANFDLVRTIKSQEKTEEYRDIHRGCFIFQMPQNSEV